jgi:hypothetical protein
MRVVVRWAVVPPFRICQAMMMQKQETFPSAFPLCKAGNNHSSTSVEGADAEEEFEGEESQLDSSRKYTKNSTLVCEMRGPIRGTEKVVSMWTIEDIILLVWSRFGTPNGGSLVNILSFAPWLTILKSIPKSLGPRDLSLPIYKRMVFFTILRLAMSDREINNKLIKQKSWWNMNWKWFVPVGGILLLLAARVCPVYVFVELNSGTSLL